MAEVASATQPIAAREGEVAEFLGIHTEEDLQAAAENLARYLQVLQDIDEEQRRTEALADKLEPPTLH